MNISSYHIVFILCLAFSWIFFFIKLQKNHKKLKKHAEKIDYFKNKLEREKKFSKTLVDSIPGIFYIFDKSGKIISWNNKLDRLLKVKSPKNNPIILSEITAEENRELVKSKTEEFFSKNIYNEMELPICSDIGKKIPYYCTFSPINLEGSKHLMGFGIDISLYKKAEDDRSQSEERLRLAAEATELGTWYLDLVTESFRWSDRCYAIFGLKPGTPMSYAIFLTCLHPDDRQRTHSAVMASLNPADPREYDIEYRAIWPDDGSVHWISARGKAFFETVDGKLKATRMNGTTLDITQRKLTAEALRESEQKYRSLFAVEPDALILFDKKTLRIMEANESALNLYGYSRKEFLDLDIISISANTEKPESLFLPFIDNTKYGIQDYHKRKDNKTIPVEVSGCAFDLCDRKVIYLAIRDITERKSMEKELNEARRNLELRVQNRTAELTTVNIRLQKEITEHKETEKELKKYHHKLLALAAELSMAEDKERRRIASDLHDDIGQTLAMSRIKIESLLLSDIPLPISTTIEEIRHLLVSSIHKVRSLTSQLSPPLLHQVGFSAALQWLGEKFHQESNLDVEITGDTIKKELGEEIGVTLFQIIRELLFNIKKHAKAQKASICTKVIEGKIINVISDDGIGFDTTKINRKDGFGLFNIQQKVIHLGGKILFESKKGEGTKVTVIAPFKILSKH